jgi:hypothetical protein
MQENEDTFQLADTKVHLPRDRDGNTKKGSSPALQLLHLQKHKCMNRAMHASQVFHTDGDVQCTRAESMPCLCSMALATEQTAGDS